MYDEDFFNVLHFHLITISSKIKTLRSVHTLYMYTKIKYMYSVNFNYID